MKRIFTLTIMLFALVSFVSLQAQTKTTDTKKADTKTQVQHGKNFVDKNNDGICDNKGTDKQCKNNCTGKEGKGNHAKKQNCTNLGKDAGSTTCTGTCDGTGHNDAPGHKGGSK